MWFISLHERFKSKSLTNVKLVCKSSTGTNTVPIRIVGVLCPNMHGLIRKLESSISLIILFSVAVFSHSWSNSAPPPTHTHKGEHLGTSQTAIIIKYVKRNI